MVAWRPMNAESVAWVMPRLVGPPGSFGSLVKPPSNCRMNLKHFGKLDAAMTVIPFWRCLKIIPSKHRLSDHQRFAGRWIGQYIHRFAVNDNRSAGDDPRVIVLESAGIEVVQAVDHGDHARAGFEIVHFVGVAEGLRRIEATNAR